MDGPREYYANWNKSDKDKYTIVSHMCGILKSKTKKQNKTKKLIETETKGMVVRGEENGGTGKRGDMINNIVISLHGDRWLLELVGW